MRSTTLSLLVSLLLALGLASCQTGHVGSPPDATPARDTAAPAVDAALAADAARAFDVAVEAPSRESGSPELPRPADAGAPDRAVAVDARPPARDAADDRPSAGPFRMLVLSKTLEYHHDSIPACQQMLRDLGATPDAELPAGATPGSQWQVTIANEDLSEFTDEGLRPYAILFWCSPTGTVFSSAGPAGVVGMAAVQKFLTTGGAWGGVHSATDFENTHGWTWFQDNVNGANFAMHDGDGTPDSIVWQPDAVAGNHPVIRGIGSPWSATDEWYFLTRDPGTLPGFSVLGRLAKDNRPAVYVREIPGGGRSFYTIRGHNTAYYAEPKLRRLVHQGVLWAVRRMK
jgi:type 1 glutamine amidotransferase